MTSILISDWLHQVYVFGARMGRADLGYVMKTNDKVQLELAELDTVILRFGVEIRYRASLVWVGPPPRLDENCEDFPHHVGNVIMPFITKVDMDNERNVIIIISVQRGFSVEDFTRLVRGEMEPKPREDAAASSAIISPATVTATAATVRSVSNCQN